ncbi:MAG TPA: DciA family protein, partial [Thermomonas sp.]|nr:DciA family protein [Thermomonas sp.]
MDQLLRPALPAGVNAHARLANLRGKTLVFIADAPVWHAKLRLATPELIAAARSIGLEVDAVTIKLATRPWQPHPATITPRIPPSAASQKGLAAALALLRAPTAEDAGSLH